MNRPNIVPRTRTRFQGRFTTLPLLLALLLLAVSLLSAQSVPGYYVVELTEEPAAARAGAQISRQGRLREDLYDEFRQPALEQQRRIRRSLVRHGAQPLSSVDTVVNAITVKIPDTLAENLASLPGVRRVYPVRFLQRTLDHAIGLHSVTDAWVRMGGDSRAGVGVKIGIVDTGIDPGHTAIADPSPPMPDGFPRVNRSSDLPFTSNRVIVARDYTWVIGTPGATAADVEGHGTAVAAAAAGRLQPFGEVMIGGVAPKAYLGNYKVFPPGQGARTDVILKAVDDAVRDGMDVINLSLGSPFARRPQDDILARAFEKASNLGVVVVVSAGNSGPDSFTTSDLAISEATISVGASPNDRAEGSLVRFDAGMAYEAIPGSGPEPTEAISAPMSDVSLLDTDGLACGRFPSNSLNGQIAFILRGDCTFEEKLNNAQGAGAVGAVVYTSAEDPEPFPMFVGFATLPGVMVSHSDGLAIRDFLLTNPGASAGVEFDVVLDKDPNNIADFSSRGPGTGYSIEPDLLAIGEQLTTASLGGGYEPADGTSFSSPLVAGAAAVLKSARPGLTTHNYRSMLINTATPLVLNSGETAPIQGAGGGLMNLSASLETNIAAFPAMVSFGITEPVVNRLLRFHNLGTESETYTITVESYGDGPGPAIAESGIEIAGGSSRAVVATVNREGLPSGEYQGQIWARGSRPGSEIHVPYWFAVPTGQPSKISILDQVFVGAAGQTVLSAIAVRTTDSTGVPAPDSRPVVTAVEGGGGVVNVVSLDEDYPELYVVHVRLGQVPGDNVYRIQVGDLTEDVTIEGL